MAGHLPGDHADVHGDDAVAVHHLPADVRRGREGEEDQGRHEDYGVEGVGLLVSRYFIGTRISTELKSLPSRSGNNTQ